MQRNNRYLTALRIVGGLLYLLCVLLVLDTIKSNAQTATVTPVPTEVETGQPTATSTVGPTGVITLPIVTPSPSHTTTLQPTPTGTGDPVTVTPGTPTVTPTGSLTPTQFPTDTPIPETPSPEPTTTITGTLTVTPTEVPTQTGVPSVTPIETTVPEPTTTIVPTGTLTAIPPLTPVPTVTPTVQAPATSVEPAPGGSTISVIGTGTIAGEPELAQAQIGVESLQPNMQDASREVDERVGTVMQVLNSQGIDLLDIHTTAHTITREGSATTGGYRVSKQFIVTLRDPAQIATILDSVVGAGANPLITVSFTRDETGDWRAEAWTLALQDAREQAAQIAAALNVTLGPVLHVRELEARQAQAGGRPATSLVPQDVSPNGALQPTIRVEVVFAMQE